MAALASAKSGSNPGFLYTRRVWPVREFAQLPIKRHLCSESPGSAAPKRDGLRGEIKHSLRKQVNPEA